MFFLSCFFFFFFFFFFNDTATTEIYTLSLHDALPIFVAGTLIACWIVPGTVVAGGSAIVPIFPPHGKQTRVDEATFVDIKLAILVSPISHKDTQRLVSADRGVTAHGLIVYGHAAIHSTARNQVAQYVSDIGT